MREQSALNPHVLECLIILRDILSDLEEEGYTDLLPDLEGHINETHKLLEEEHTLRMGNFPQRVLFIGDVGVGKSTLINHILGEAFTQSRPGQVRPNASQPEKKVGFVKRVFRWFRKRSQAKRLDEPGLTSVSLHLSHGHDYSGQVSMPDGTTNNLILEEFPSLDSLGTALLQRGITPKEIHLKVPDEALLDLELIDTPPFSQAQTHITQLIKEDAALLIFVMRADREFDPQILTHLSSYRDPIFRAPPAVVMTHIDQLNPRKLKQVVAQISALTPHVYPVDLRPFSAAHPHDRGLRWKEHLTRLSEISLAREQPLQVAIDHLASGYKRVSYEISNTQHSFILPPKEPGQLQPLRLLISEVQDDKSYVANQRVNLKLAHYHGQMTNYTSRLDLHLSKLTVLIRGAEPHEVMSEISGMISHLIGRKKLTEKVRSLLTVRNLTNAEASYFFTPYAGVVLGSLSQSWLGTALTKAFRVKIEHSVEQTLMSQPSSILGSAYNRELFDRWFGDFTQQSAEGVQGGTVQEWAQLDGTIVKQYEDLAEAEILSVEFINELTENIVTQICDDFTARFTEACQGYCKGLTGHQRSLIETKVTRIEVIRDKFGKLNEAIENMLR